MTLRIADSRRLTGPSLLLDVPGAVLDVETGDADIGVVIAAWRSALERMLPAVGWSNAVIASRSWSPAAGASLAYSAPADALYAATEVNEWAFSAARAGLTGSAANAQDTVLARSLEGHAGESFEEAAARLRAAIAGEQDAELMAIAEEAGRRGITFLADDRRVSIGLGQGSRSWPADDLAARARVPWDGTHDIPVALVTGTNGKSTTVRLLAAIAEAAGQVAGTTSTDGVSVGSETVARGDYSGPNGARSVLRDRRVEVGILELARGGILRRGLAIPHATAALVTNVANDHLGEFGVYDLETLADVKMVVAKAVGPGGRVVLNADDPRLLARGRALNVPVTWFSLDPSNPVLRAHVAADGHACWLEGDRLVRWRHGGRDIVTSLDQVPITFGGAARHNIANALAAIGLANALGFEVEAIARGLASFQSSSDANPGRANVWDLGGITAIVDFAHNPHGLLAMAAMARAVPAERRALVIGQAGDRDDEAIRELAHAAWTLRPDRIFVKEMEIYLRGRERGVVPAMIDRTLREAGAPAEAIEHCDSELSAVRRALEWARTGDLLLLTTHAEREAVIALLQELQTRGWTAGSGFASLSAP